MLIEGDNRLVDEYYRNGWLYFETVDDQLVFVEIPFKKYTTDMHEWLKTQTKGKVIRLDINVITSYRFVFERASEALTFKLICC